MVIGKTKKRSLYFEDRKEYYRLKGFKSFGVKLKGDEPLTKTQKKKKVKKFRVRRQVVLNAESKGSGLGISIRAISINGEHTLGDMEKALDDFMFSNQALKKMPYVNKGFEEEEIADNEDRGLKENTIYIELNVRGSVNLISL